MSSEAKNGGLGRQEEDREPVVRRPLVTVITAVLNGQAHLEDTIKSVANQSYRKIEHVVVDGGSTDSTLDIITAHENSIGLWISESDSGMYDALNKGIRLSQGELLTFLNADDYLNGEHAIETVVKEFENDSSLDWCYCDVRVSFEDRESHIYRIPPYDKEALLSLGWCYVPHPGSFFRRGLFERFGLFDDRYKLVGDYEFFLRIGGQTRVKHLAFSPVTYRHHSNRLTERGSARRKIEHKEVQRSFNYRGRNARLALHALWLMVRFRLLNYDIYTDRLKRVITGVIPGAHRART